MDGALLLLALGTLGTKIIDVFKYLRNRNFNGALTQVGVWAAGIGVFSVAAAADVFNAVEVPGTGLTFGQLDGGTLVFLGLSASSFLSVFGIDIKKAIDGSDSAAMPKLFK